MVKIIVASLLMLVASISIAADNPEINDMDISKRFGVTTLAPVDARRQTMFVSSFNASQLSQFLVYSGSTTLTPGASTVVALPTWNAVLLPSFSEQNTSSKTVSCQSWTSSFTLTNTSGVETKTVNWMAFARSK